ncbi:RagB/SusD family nutrient uptake outer membrane protein [Wenyingzhuangia sp. chi5]|uniref:RagB/SusD family nutrient uptake outer membrane protein n=1 Tax=Wenyingzhuangia gilva TaxID=3057677 RepID=A0ABT8VUI5_9FLAO|nr:RagB/SusD family nutrient uptake outer membrane protein [Wenyingzhuangia sp. chi5]MDO3695636.1 RagB/SusD family nutrient uptake outer membrane protein [Wenyingzhuangia sp. chi5]
MKYINKTIFTILLAAGAISSSCESYLEEENYTAVSLESANKSSDIFDQLVGSVYERARETTTYYQPEMMYALEDVGTDIVTRGAILSGTDPINDYVNFNSTNNVVRVYWGNQYKVIASANLAIDNAVNIQGLEESAKNTGIGEAKFFRALSYFNLVENFGGVPLIINQVTPADTEIKYSRSTEEQVYTQILKDLNEALLAVDETPDDYGRVSKDAVRHIMSKVLLTRAYKSFADVNDFTEAAALAETVIANHDLVATFPDLIDINNQRNSEVVFSYLFGSDPVSRGWGNSRHQLYKFDYFNYPGMTRGNKGIGPAPTPFFYSLFGEDDERAEATYRRAIYAEKNYVKNIAGTDVTVVAGDTAIYFPKTAWSQTAIDAARYKVINPGTYFENDGITSVHYPMFKKFDDPSTPFAYTDQESAGQRDMVMMRSGEAYLIAAEAYLGASNPTTAAARLTTLRARAGLTTPVLPTEVTLDFILDERARELVGEVNRWMDLKRTGKLIERTLMHNPHAKFNNALNAKNLLRPIPQVEIDNSGGNITQNPI